VLRVSRQKAHWIIRQPEDTSQVRR
jgi:hypothetical protein